MITQSVSDHVCDHVYITEVKYTGCGASEITGFQKLEGKNMTLPELNLLTRTEAANFLCISVATIDRLRKKNKITCRKILGRIFFAKCDLIDFLISCAIPARADGDEK